MNTQGYKIKTETADAIRAAAPLLGLRASDMRQDAEAGVEVLELPALVALKFDQLRKGWKVGVDAAALRIIRQATA